MILAALLLFCILGYVFFSRLERQEKEANRPPPELPPNHPLRVERGDLNPLIVCPHCMRPGGVRVKRLPEGSGVEEGQVGAAVVNRDGSLSIIGMSRQEKRTQHSCGRCGSVWAF